MTFKVALQNEQIKNIKILREKAFQQQLKNKIYKIQEPTWFEVMHLRQFIL